VEPPAVLLLVIINVNSGESYHNTPSLEREKTTERRTMVAALLKNRATPLPPGSSKFLLCMVSHIQKKSDLFFNISAMRLTLHVLAAFDIE
jgi:hypothetical protein